MTECFPTIKRGGDNIAHTRRIVIIEKSFSARFLTSGKNSIPRIFPVDLDFETIFRSARFAEPDAKR